MTNKPLKNRLIFSLSEADGKLNLFLLSYPVILQEIFNYLLSSIHTLILSKVSEEAVAAVGVSSTLITIMGVFISCVSVGLMILLSFALGRNKQDEARSLFTAGIITAFVLAVLSGAAVAAFAPKILSLYSLSGVTLDFAIDYLRLRMLFLFISAFSTVISAVLRCFGKTFIIMLAGMVSNVTNALFSVFAVSRYSPFENKVAALALAAVIGQTVSLIITSTVALKKLKPAARVDIKRIVHILKLGIPSVYGNLSYYISVTVTTAFVSAIGVSAINTRVYVNNITMYVPLVSSALSQATSIMLGRLLGRKDFTLAKCFVRQNGIIAACSNTLFSVAVFLLSKPLLSLFTANPDIIRTAQSLMLIDIFIELTRAVNHIYANSALVCAEDVYFSSFTGMASSWVISVGGCWLLCNYFEMGLIGCYIAFAADEGIRAVLSLLRWKYGPWERHLKKSLLQ